MGRKKHEARILEDLSEIEIVQLEEVANAEIEEQVELPRSVVKRAYKAKYRDRARLAEVKGKAGKRSAWDWLAQTLAGEVLDKKEKLIVERFVAVLEANGIADPLTRWPSQTPGWEGRLRMTGRLALQRIVAETGVLVVPDFGEGGETLEAPAEWVAKFLN